MSLVAGVDGCRAGWVVAIAESIAGRLRLQGVAIAPSFKDMLVLTQTCVAVGVDIPIGLCEHEPRLADGAARKLLGGARASSVFPAPVQAVLEFANDYRAACDASEAACGKRISKQLFMILPKIVEANDAMTPSLQRRVVEVHPEVSFWALNGGAPLPASKHKLEGLRQRATLLSAAYGQEMSMLAVPRGAQRDDLYDACAAAWTASRIADGSACRLPVEPLLDVRGLRMEIVY